ncbi:protein FAM166B [Mugil cephalus]|uniref:protein FAM166B n=1 Tax=Mugil cephalus TaxID=48193 RepID=UPI001FB5AF90|nr:protein FAM166B [Mugil cephalus]
MEGESCINGTNMEQYAPKFSQVLLTPDPHYIPGYSGYCPQLKFNIAKTYGKLTGELLTSPEVKHSSRLVLHTGHVPSTDTPRSSTDSNLKRMIPGYTGFIPKRQNYFACSYSETCHKALSEFYHEGEVRLQRQSTDLPVVVNHRTQQTDRLKPPLTVISDKVITYKPLKPFVPTGKPYFMEDDNPQKYFIPGFAGHVPKSRFLFGKVYPIITNQALTEFGKQHSYFKSKDVSSRTNSCSPTMPTIYPPNRGGAPSFCVSNTLHVTNYLTNRSY